MGSGGGEGDDVIAGIVSAGGLEVHTLPIQAEDLGSTPSQKINFLHEMSQS